MSFYFLVIYILWYHLLLKILKFAKNKKKKTAQMVTSLGNNKCLSSVLKLWLPLMCLPQPLEGVSYILNG